MDRGALRMREGDGRGQPCRHPRHLQGDGPLEDKPSSNAFSIAPADTIGDEVAIAEQGLVTAVVGQRPFEMGYTAPSVMLDLIKGKKVDDPVFTGIAECTKDTPILASRSNS